MHCQMLFTPTYLLSFRVYTLKNTYKHCLRSGKDEIRHHDTRKDLPMQAEIDAKRLLVRERSRNSQLALLFFVP